MWRTLSLSAKCVTEEVDAIAIKIARADRRKRARKTVVANVTRADTSAALVSTRYRCTTGATERGRSGGPEYRASTGTVEFVIE